MGFPDRVCWERTRSEGRWERVWRGGSEKAAGGAVRLATWGQAENRAMNVSRGPSRPGPFAHGFEALDFGLPEAPFCRSKP